MASPEIYKLITKAIIVEPPPFFYNPRRQVSDKPVQEFEERLLQRLYTLDKEFPGDGCGELAAHILGKRAAYNQGIQGPVPAAVLEMHYKHVRSGLWFKQSKWPHFELPSDDQLHGVQRHAVRASPPMEDGGFGVLYQDLGNLLHYAVVLLDQWYHGREHISLDYVRSEIATGHIGNTVSQLFCALALQRLPSAEMQTKALKFLQKAQHRGWKFYITALAVLTGEGGEWRSCPGKSERREYEQLQLCLRWISGVEYDVFRQWCHRLDQKLRSLLWPDGPPGRRSGRP